MSDAIHVHGRCYCGSITFEVNLPAGEDPIFTAYCHCDSCRRAHAAPLYHVATVDEPRFRITGGAEHLREFRRPGAHVMRAFCGVCGSRILNRFPGWNPGGKTPLAFFPNLLDEEFQRDLPEALRPHRDNRAQESVLDEEMIRRHLARGD